MASGYTKIDELDFELTGSSTLRDHLERVRQLSLALNMELEFAAAELQARLEKTDPCCEKRSYETGSATKRRAARQVARGYKRMAEMALGMAQLTPKTWKVFVRNYVDVTVKTDKSKFDVNT